MKKTRVLPAIDKYLFRLNIRAIAKTIVLVLSFSVVYLSAIQTGSAFMPQDTITVSGQVTDTDGAPILHGQVLIFGIIILKMRDIPGKKEQVNLLLAFWLVGYRLLVLRF